MREVEHRDNALVGDPVEHGAVLTACLDEAAPAQAREVVRHLRLCEPEPFDQLADRELALVTKQLENPQANRVAETAEVLRDEIGLDRSLGKTKRRGGTHQAASISACLDMTRMPRPVDREELQRLVAAGAQLVEVLPPAEYEEEHLPGAINVPLKDLTRAGVERLDRDRPLIVYCYDTT